MSADILASALETIRSLRGEAQRRGVILIGVTGSVARGEAGPGSDVDVVYEVAGRPTLFDLGELSMDMKEQLGREVDLIDLHHVKPRLREAMERDLVRV